MPWKKLALVLALTAVGPGALAQHRLNRSLAGGKVSVNFEPSLSILEIDSGVEISGDATFAAPEPTSGTIDCAIRVYIIPIESRTTRFDAGVMNELEPSTFFGRGRVVEYSFDEASPYAGDALIISTSKSRNRREQVTYHKASLIGRSQIRKVSQQCFVKIGRPIADETLAKQVRNLITVSMR